MNLDSIRSKTVDRVKRIHSCSNRHNTHIIGLEKAVEAMDRLPLIIRLATKTNNFFHVHYYPLTRESASILIHLTLGPMPLMVRNPFLSAHERTSSTLINKIMGCSNTLRAQTTVESCILFQLRQPRSLVPHLLT